MGVSLFANTLFFVTFVVVFVNIVIGVICDEMANVKAEAEHTNCFVTDEQRQWVEVQL